MTKHVMVVDEDATDEHSRVLKCPTCGKRVEQQQRAIILVEGDPYALHSWSMNVAPIATDIEKED